MGKRTWTKEDTVLLTQAFDEGGISRCYVSFPRKTRASVRNKLESIGLYESIPQEFTKGPLPLPQVIDGDMVNGALLASRASIDSLAIRARVSTHQLDKAIYTEDYDCFAQDDKAAILLATKLYHD